MNEQFALSIPLAWQYVRQVRSALAEALGGHDERLRRAAIMTGSELVENAIKYGESVESLTHVLFSFDLGPREITLHIANGTTNLDGVRELGHQLDLITAAPDKERLYMGRLRELIADPSQTGGLGLFRIGFEGRFGLSWSYREQVVTVTATRGIGQDSV